MERTIGIKAYLAREREAAGAATDFIAARLPIFAAWLACGIVVVLLLFVVYMTFVLGVPTAPTISLQNYIDTFDSYLFRRVIPNTVIVGVGTVMMVLFFSVPLAWLLNRTDVPFRDLWITLIAVSVIVPGFLKAIGWFMLLSPEIGLINKFLISGLGLQQAPLSITNVWGVAFVQGLMLTPTMFFLLAGPVQAMDPALEEAAQVSGATMWKTMRWVSLPILWPAIQGGGIYTFMTAISLFEVAAFLGGIGRTPVLATELFISVQPVVGLPAALPRYGVAGIYGLLIAIPSLVALYCYLRLIKKEHQYAVITGKGYRPRQIDLGRARYWGLAFVVFYVLLAVAFPMLMLVWASLLPYLVMPSAEALSLLSLQWYLRIMEVIGGSKVLVNTIALTVVTPIVVLFFGLMMSWVVVKSRTRGRALIDTVAMLPHAVPGLSFAFALMVVGIVAARWMPWFPLYQTIGILVIANAVNRLSYVTRIMNAALLQVGRELEESAEICGARRLGAIRWVIAPLIKPSLVFGGIWTGLLVFREISIALMLVGPNSQVLSVRIWQAWERGDLSQASALGVIMVLAMAVVIFLAPRVTEIRLTEPHHTVVSK